MKENRKSKKSILLQMLRIAAYLVLGVLFLAFPDMVISLLPIILGALLLFETMFKVIRILTLWKKGYPNWWIPMIGCAVMILLGILLATEMFDQTYTLIRVLGGGLLIDGILEFWIQMAQRKCAKAVKNGTIGISGDDMPNAEDGYADAHADDYVDEYADEYADEHADEYTEVHEDKPDTADDASKNMSEK